MTIAFVSLSIVFVAEIVALIGLCFLDRSLRCERLLLADKWEELAKQAEEVASAADEVSSEVKRQHSMAIGYAEAYDGKSNGRGGSNGHTLN